MDKQGGKGNPSIENSQEKDVRRSDTQERSKEGNQQQKRKQWRDDPVRLAYANVDISVRPSSGRPGTPHRYFDSSHDVNFRAAEDDATRDTVEAAASPAGTVASRSSETPIGDKIGAEEAEIQVDQVVHRHLNGLCIVTAGEALMNLCSSASTGPTIRSVEFIKAESDGQSVGAKRKKAKKAKHAKKAFRGGNGRDEDKGTTRPLDTLAIASLSDGRTVNLKCCVLGTVLELNRRLDGQETEIEKDAGKHTVNANGNPSLLVTDPLLDGYLAVILPTGSFPPRTIPGEEREKRSNA